MHLVAENARHESVREGSGSGILAFDPDDGDMRRHDRIDAFSHNRPERREIDRIEVRAIGADGRQVEV
jgi:hypothetical protein